MYLKLFKKGRKLFLTLCFVSLYFTQPTAIYAQNTTNSDFTISMTQASLIEVFDYIKSHSDFAFIYGEQIKNSPVKKNVNLKGKTINEVLDALSTLYGVTYQKTGHTISVKEEVKRRETIKGVIRDENNLTVPGATIVLKGTTEGTTSDLDGAFTIQAIPHQDQLEINFIGYKPQLVTANTTMNIQLKVDQTSLDEIVVIGYGTQEKVNLTGAISVVDKKDLEDRPITNATQALQGVSGVYVNQAGGQPGHDAASIRIRGIGTVGSGAKLDPLVIVDGIEYSLSDVNPNDIETISVLKDAASASIYGSRAANGVILITTKNGKRGDMRVEYSNYTGFQKATYLPDVVDSSVDFMEMYNRAMVNQGGKPYYSDELIQRFRDNPTSQQYPNTNWMKEMFKRAPITEHNLRMSGGNELTTYNMSLGYLNQEGVLKEMSGAKRYSVNLKVNSKLNKRLTVEGGIMATRWDIEEPSQGVSVVMNRLMRMVPIQPVGRMENGDWPDSWVLTPGQNSFQNPLIYANEGYRERVKDRLLINTSFDLMLAEGLHYNVRAAANQYYERMKDWNPEVSLHNVFTGEKTRDWSSSSIKTERDDQNLKLNATQLLTYKKLFAQKHALHLLLGSSIETFEGSFNTSSVRGYPTMDLTELNIGTHTPGVSGTSYKDVLVSYFGRIQYSYDDKYLLEVNSRYDGSSRFSKNNRWSFFPSLSLGWRISQEEFMQDLVWLNELKVRGSWGKIGNQEIGRFQYLNTVALGQGYSFGGTYEGGSAITQFKDPSISWETTTMTNIGLDWSLFKGSLIGSFEFFNKQTDDILRTVALPSQVGSLAGPTQNIAKVENKGYEIGLLYRGNITKDFSFTIGGSLTKVKNEVIDLAGETMISGGRITKEGLPLNSWYVYKTDGLYQSEEEVKNSPTISNRVGPGDVKYVDLNKDGKIDGEDRYVAGSTYPKYTYSFNLGFKYKNFALDTFWQGVSDVQVYLDGNMAMPFNNGAGLTKEWLTDSWTVDNPTASLPRITAKNQYTENFSQSDYWLKDASYLRLKNIQLSYSLGAKTLDKIGLSQLKIFVNAQNILTISDLKVFDPEKDVMQNDIGEYPSVKMVTMGINLKF